MAPARQQFPAGKDRAAIEAYLRDRGATRTPHPGGTLLEHLRRVQQLPAEWGASPAVQTAGLCHATYGTDGFAPSLPPHSDRPTLVALIGEPAGRWSTCTPAATARPSTRASTAPRKPPSRTASPAASTAPAQRPAGVSRNHGRQRTRRTGAQRGTGQAARTRTVRLAQTGRLAAVPGPHRTLSPDDWHRSPRRPALQGVRPAGRCLRGRSWTPLVVLPHRRTAGCGCCGTWPRPGNLGWDRRGFRTRPRRLHRPARPRTRDGS
ncbi:DUF6817 domain-containing protein [Streptomyces eurythermus]|uniref:DUF6817 domain-containing protein n=1 Tax=Streptomyces eurythermus TaxID=42237 RepID=UPI0036FC6281